MVQCKNKGDKSAWQQLYKQTERSVYYTCLKLLSNEHDAQDAIQDTYLTAMQKLDTLGDPTKFPKWINVIAVNKCKKSFTKHSEESLDEISEQGFDTADGDPIPEDYVTDAAKRRIIMDIIDRELTPEQRQTVILYYYNEIKIPEIAHLMDCPVSTVSYRLNAAGKKMREAVLIYEEKKDDKLHAIIPIPILSDILNADSQSVAVPDIQQALGLTQTAQAAQSAQSMQYAQSQTNAPANQAVNAAVNNGGKAMLASGKSKIIAIAIAAALVVGGVVTFAVLKSGKDEVKTGTDVSAKTTLSDDGNSAAATTKTSQQTKKTDSSSASAEHNYVQTAESDYDFIEFDDHIMLGTYKDTEQYIITPTEIKGKPVTCIDFTNNSSKCKIKGIKISEGVTELCDQAFRYLNIEEVELPESLEYIGASAFSDDTNKGSLSGTVKIPKNVKFIDRYAFSQSKCDFEFSGSVEYIGEKAFQSKTMMAKQNEALNSDGMYIIDKVLVRASGTGELKIPDGIVTIAPKALENTSFEKVVVPSSVKIIGDGAFVSMNNLKELDIQSPENITHMGGRLFNAVGSLKVPWWEEYQSSHDEWIVGDILC